MRILLTNDDGINAEGLQALERIARVLSDDIWICAPEYEQSGASRALTLMDPLRVRRLDERRFALEGTPTDCVMLAMQELMPERPDLVLSGVNRGQNLGEDVTVSGTVAGAMQGMALSVSYSVRFRKGKLPEAFVKELNRVEGIQNVELSLRDAGESTV